MVHRRSTSQHHLRARVNIFRRVQCRFGHPPDPRSHPSHALTSGPLDGRASAARVRGAELPGPRPPSPASGPGWSAPASGGSGWLRGVAGSSTRMPNPRIIPDKVGSYGGHVQTARYPPDPPDSDSGTVRARLGSPRRVGVRVVRGVGSGWGRFRPIPNGAAGNVGSACDVGARPGRARAGWREGPGYRRDGGPLGPGLSGGGGGEPGAAPAGSTGPAGAAAASRAMAARMAAST